MLHIKRVHSQSLREEVYALRYRAYIHENAIEPCGTQRFEDKYDSQPNNILWALTENQRVVGSIRTTWFDPASSWSIPEIDGYAEDVKKVIPHGKKILSGNRFVTDPNRIERGSSWAIFLLRHHMLVAESRAQFALAAVRTNHLQFYSKVLKLDRVSEGRIYPGLKSTMFLTACEFQLHVNQVYELTPKLKPRGYERLLLDVSYQDLWEIGLPLEADSR
jgi:hypothetical protein